MFWPSRRILFASSLILDCIHDRKMPRSIFNKGAGGAPKLTLAAYAMTHFIKGLFNVLLLAMLFIVGRFISSAREY